MGIRPDRIDIVSNKARADQEIRPKYLKTDGIGGVFYLPLFEYIRPIQESSWLALRPLFPLGTGIALVSRRTSRSTFALRTLFALRACLSLGTRIPFWTLLSLRTWRTRVAVLTWGALRTSGAF